MSRSFCAAIFLIFLAFLSACQTADKYQDPFRVISDDAIIYERPSNTSKALQELKFGAEVMCREKNPSFAVPKGWIEAKSGAVRGFIEKKEITGKDIYDEIRGLMDGAKDASVQAVGLTRKKTALRLKPKKDAFLIERLKEPARVDVLERIVLTTDDKEKSAKQLWYKIRLSNGHAGYIYKSDIELIPPGELNVYTSVRTPVTWYVLGKKEDPATGISGNDYLVSYASVDSDIETDFTRIELYQFDPKSRQYATALARSGMYGMLPIKIIDEGGGKKIIEIREHPRGDAKKIHVMQYSYPSPIKIVKEYVEAAN